MFLYAIHNFHAWNNSRYSVSIDLSNNSFHMSFHYICISQRATLCRKLQLFILFYVTWKCMKLASVLVHKLFNQTIFFLSFFNAIYHLENTVKDDILDKIFTEKKIYHSSQSKKCVYQVLNIACNSTGNL